MKRKFTDDEGRDARSARRLVRREYHDNLEGRGMNFPRPRHRAAHFTLGDSAKRVRLETEPADALTRGRGMRNWRCVMEIEFVDRYGPEGPPSWLRACRADCEATGVVPHKPRWWVDKRPGNLTDVSILYLDPPTKSELAYDEQWCKAEAITPAEDGWHFVECPECSGTGRVWWWVTIARIPKWIMNGCRFIWAVRGAEMHPPGTKWWSRFSLAFKCAFLADLGLWKP